MPASLQPDTSGIMLPQTSGAFQPEEGEDDGADIDQDQAQPWSQQSQGGSYADIHGPTLEALDAKLNATAKANQSLAAQQQVLTKQREALGQQAALDKQTATLAAQRHAVAASQTPEGAFALAASQQGPQGQGVFSAPPGMSPTGARAGTQAWQQHLQGFDPDQHLKDMNYDQSHWDEANAELKKNTGKTAHEMYDELENRGLVLPSDAKLTDRQKGELFLKFGMRMLQQQHAGLVRPDQWVAPNAGRDFAKAAEGTLGDYDEILNQQRQGVLQAYQEKQKIGLEAAGKQATLEDTQAKEGAATTRERETQAAATSRTADTNKARMYNADQRRAGEENSARARAADKPDASQIIQKDDGTYLSVDKVTGKGRPVTQDGQPVTGAKETDKDKSKDRADAADQRAYEAEEERALTLAQKQVDNIDNLNKDGTPKKTADQLKDEIAATMPAHAKRAQTDAPAKTKAADSTKLVRPDQKGFEHNGRVYDGVGDWNDPGSWKAK
jgi:hypothetical protein